MNPFALCLKAVVTRQISHALWVTFCVLALAIGAGTPRLAHSAPLFGNWVGQAQMGEKLKVNMTIFGLNKDAQSQLKAGCMEAWAESDGTESNSIQTRVDLNLDYGKTLDRGGLLTLSSKSPINDPVLRVHITSNCPLVTFAQSWDLQLDFIPKNPTKETFNPHSQVARVSESDAGGPLAFTLNKSATLTASYKKPVIQSEPVERASKQESTQKPVASNKSYAGNHDNLNASKPRDPNLVKLPQTNEELVLLPSTTQTAKPAQLENIAMRQATPAPTAMQVNPASEAWARDPALTGDNTNLMPFILFGFVSLVMIAFGVWWGQRQGSPESESSIGGHRFGLDRIFSRKEKKPVQSLKTEHPSEDVCKPEFRSTGAIQDSDPGYVREHPGSGQLGTLTEDISNAQGQVDAFNKQLFESFLGGDQTLDDANDSYAASSHRASKSAQVETKSFVSRVSESQNLSLGPWKLPEAYQALLPVRSSADLAADEVNQCRLKCEMGLIELAFLNAQQGELVFDIQVAELLDVLGPLQGEDNAQAPSDLIKDFVRSRVCELGSKPQIEKFTEALKAMSGSEHCKKLSMANGLWLEFVQNLEVN